MPPAPTNPGKIELYSNYMIITYNLKHQPICKLGVWLHSALTKIKDDIMSTILHLWKLTWQWKNNGHGCRSGPAPFQVFFLTFNSWFCSPYNIFSWCRKIGGNRNVEKRKTLKGNQGFPIAKRSFSGQEWKSLSFFTSFAKLSSLIPYIVRISTEHVGKDICLQARIHFLRVIFRSHLGTQGLDMCKVCTEAVNCVALWTRTLSQVWTCVKYVPKQTIA